ncbi:MAG TPA: glucan biosynthesis protein G [Acetobacteraceae bacterium]|nr:glucan biosynthesis protein G [Acetobacteraceae bacterium]
MHRRELLAAGATAFVLPTLAARAQQHDDAAPFDAGRVRTMARELAAQPYKAPDTSLPDTLKDLDYQAYRAIRFNPAHALWRGAGLNFTVEFFHRGFLFKDRVDIYEVVDGRATPIHYSPDLFSFGKTKPPPANADIGFAGFRIHSPMNRPDYYDEVCAFQGASYFRAVAKGQGYGLSARGLAIKTGSPGGEEFPVFKTFWIERPPKGSSSIVVHALLDSPSGAGAYRFTIRPGQETLFDTEMALYPRNDIAEAGIAPGTSMFFFDANNRAGYDDYRAAVHDSNGLLLRTGHDEQIWRPLTNPRTLQISSFVDTNSRGFGLMQRKRDFVDYQDLEAHYEKRPSLWVEPIGDWGSGAVELVEIPSTREINDNIVAFWRPHDPLKAKREYLMNYRLHWCWSVPGETKVAKIAQTRCGLSWDQKNRLFVIDAVGPALNALAAGTAPTLDSGSDGGKLQNTVVEPNPELKGWRISLQLAPEGKKLVEMHARLMDGDKPLTETWIYRWTS